MKTETRFWIVISAIVSLSGVLLIGCGKPEEALGKVRGSVSLDGKPMAEGEVAFVRPGRAATVLEVKNGLFDGKVPVGSHRVELYSYKEIEVIPMPGEAPIKDRLNTLPAQYNLNSKLTAEVGAGTQNTFEFSVSKNEQR